MSSSATQRKSTDLADLRHRLINNGYTPVPCVGKRPIPKAWTELQPDHSQVDAYLSHPNTGILTGQVVGIDVDVLHLQAAAELRALVMTLPGGDKALVRVGKAPKALYLFRSETPREKMLSSAFMIDGIKAQVEVMGMGQQVLAFGVHPDTAKPYTWETPSPLDVPLADLPLITAETVDQFLAEAATILARHGTAAAKPAAKRPAAGGDTFWKRVNSAALQRLESWVPALFPTAALQATGAYRVSSADLGRGLEEDLSIHPGGVQDFGREHGATPIDLVAEFGGAPDTRASAFWLCERMSVSPESLGWEQRQPVTISFGKSLPAPVPANDDDEDAEPVYIEDAPVAGLPVSLCYPPGAVGDFARFITDVARFPSPPLALAGALALTAALIGRRYKGPTGLRSNVYLVGLADSGHGKDITLRAPVAIAGSTPAGDRVIDKFFIDDLASVQGLATRLRKDPAGVLQIDEFGKWLGAITSRKAPPHKETLALAVLQLTGAASGTWGGAERAAGNMARVHNPCVSIHGVTTPSTFWAALSGGNISEGLLGRLIVIDAGNAPPAKVRRPAASLDEIPPALIEHVEALIGGNIGGNLFGLNASGERKPAAVLTAAYGPGVEDLFESFDDRIRAEHKKTDAELRPLLTRVGENAARLALIVSVGCSPGDPVITAEIQTWANAVAEASYRTIAAGAADNVADNDRQQDYLRIRNYITKKGAEGITTRMLIKQVKGRIERRQLDDILDLLQTAGEVVYGEAVASSGQKRVRWWAADHRPEVVKQVER
ncbi:bifunctional DNA primase/polymerase [Camelimonas lactis]